MQFLRKYCELFTDLENSSVGILLDDLIRRQVQKLNAKVNDRCILEIRENKVKISGRCPLCGNEIKDNGEEQIEKKHNEEKELEELKMAETSGNCHDMEEELGDVFFSLINYARFLKVDAEAALEKCNKKFITRFQLMETMAMQENKILTDLSLEEMDVLWNKAKKLLKNNG